MPLVLDASVALAWLMPDEMSAEADALFAGLDQEDVRTPPLFALEVANVLEVNIRRGRIDDTYGDQALEDLFSFPIRSESAPPPARLAAISRLARRHGLTVYDAAYLELAVRLRCDLASFDAELRAAAGAEGVALRV